MSGPVASIGVAVVPDATNFWRSFEARTLGEANRVGHREGEALMVGIEEATAKGANVNVHLDTGRAMAEIEALRAEIDTLGRSTVDVERGGRGFESRFARIARIVALLGPALVPIGAVGVAGLAALVPAAAAATAGIKGLEAQYKSGALAGTELGKNIKYMQTQWTGLQKVSAAPIGVGLNEAIAGIKAQMPAVTGQFRLFAGTIGHVVGQDGPALVHLFATNLNPLFQDLNAAVISGANSFATWANSSGALKGFVSYVSQNLPQTLSAIGGIATGIVHVLAAVAPYGHAVLGIISGIAQGIARIPTGILGPLASGALAVFAAFRTWRAIDSIIGAVTNSIAKVKGASATVGSAFGGAGAGASSAASAQSAAASSIAASNARIGESASAAATADAEATRIFVVDSDGIATARDAAAVAVAEANATIGDSLAAAAAADEQASRVFVVDSNGIAVARTAAAEEVVAANAVIAESSTATSETVVASGEAARIGWIGLAGPLGAVAVGVGLLASMFIRSSSSSKVATDSARAYMDVLQSGGSKQDIFSAVVKQLSDNNVPKLVDDVNKALGQTVVTAPQVARAVTGSGQSMSQLSKHIMDVTKSQLQMNKLTGEPLTNAYNQKRWEAATKLIKAYQVQRDALSKTAKQELFNTKAFAGAASNIKQVSAAMGIAVDTAKSYAAMVGVSVTKEGTAAVSAATLRSAITQVSAAYDNADQAGTAYLDALSKFAGSAGTSADRAALIGATLKAANGDALGFAGAINQAAVAGKALGDDMSKGAADAVKGVKGAKPSVQAFAKSIIDLKTGTIDYKNAAAGPLITDLQSLQDAAMKAAEATFQHSKATKGGAQAADDAYAVYQNYTSKYLTDNYKKLGLNRDQASRLASTYFGMPKDIKTKIEAEGTDPVLTVLNEIGELLAHIAHRKWTPVIDANANPAGAKIAALQHKLDAIRQSHQPGVDANTAAGQVKVRQLQQRINSLQGKVVIAGVSVRGQDRVNALASSILGLHDKTVYVQAIHKADVFNAGAKNQNSQPTSRRNTGATGGFVSGAGTGLSDSIPAWLSNGEFVSTAKATAEHRAELEAWNKGYAKGGLVGYAAGGPVTELVERHHKRVGRGKKAHDSIVTDLYYRFNGHIYSTAHAVINAYNAVQKAIHTTAVRERTTVATTDMARLSKSLGKDAQTVASAYGTAYNHLRAMGASSGYLAGLSKSERRLIADVNLRIKTTTQLATAQSHLKDVQGEYNDQLANTRSAMVGSFDITGAGTGAYEGQVASYASIMAQQKQAGIKASQFSGALKGLIGKGLNRTYVSQLAAAGPAALEQVTALNSASKAQIAALNKQFSAQYATGTSLGTSVAGYEYGRQLDTARALVYGRSGRDRASDADVKALANALYGKNAPAQRYLNEGLAQYAKDNQHAINALAGRMETSMKTAANTLARRPVQLIANDRQLARVVDEGRRKNARR